MKLTENQKKFADYYIETGNATESYLRAGYKVKTSGAARTNASRLLTNANITAYIEERVAEKDSERVAKQDEVLEYFTSVMRGELTEPVLVLDGEGMQRIEYLPPAFTARNKAAEQLGKRYGLWVEKQEVTGNMGVTVIKDVNRVKEVIRNGNNS